jgi:hypothetical protein
MCIRRTAIAVAVQVLAGSWTNTGSSAPDDPQLQAARRQFAQAEDDEDAGRWTNALEKLRSIFAIKQTAGVQYHVALCEENLGQLVEALADYAAADREARAESAQDVLKLVGKRLADLEPRIPRLTIHVVPDVPDAGVTLDGASVDRGLFGTAMRVNPGVHRLEATAPGRVASSAEIATHEHDATVLDMRLEPQEAPSPPVAEGRDQLPVRPRTTRQPNERAAIASGLAGLALAGGGAAAYVAGGQARDRGRGECARIVSTAPSACDPQRLAVRAWDWTAAGAWVGAAAATALAVRLWTEPSRVMSPSSSVHVLVGLGSLSVDGDF